MKKIFSIIFLTSNLIVASAQDSINVIANFPTLTYLGDPGFEISTLVNKLSFEQLDTLIKTGSPSNKVMAYSVFLNKQGSDFRNYFPQLVEDTNKFVFGQPEEVGAVISEIASSIAKSTSNAEFEYFLDSMAFDITPRHSLKKFINIRIGNIKPPSDLYDELRAKALTGDISALMGLANFRSPEDIPIFKSLIEKEGDNLLYSIVCIERFPHPSFENIIISNWYDILKDNYAIRFAFVSKVLLLYKSPNAVQAFDHLMLNHENYPNHIMALWQLVNHDKSKYKDMHNKILKTVGKKKLRKLSESYDSEKLYQEYLKRQRNK